METFHVSDADAERDLGPARRSISECIALAAAHEKEPGESPVLDPDFAEDVEGIVRNRKPWRPSAGRT